MPSGHVARHKPAQRLWSPVGQRSSSGPTRTLDLRGERTGSERKTCETSHYLLLTSYIAETHSVTSVGGHNVSWEKWPVSFWIMAVSARTRHLVTENVSWVLIKSKKTTPCLFLSYYLKKGCITNNWRRLKSLLFILQGQQILVFKCPQPKCHEFLSTIDFWKNRSLESVVMISKKPHS